MKPILEWYEQLPEPYRSQAIANYDGKRKEANSLERAIVHGFVWSHTPKHQGKNYWLDISDKAKRGEFTKPTLEQTLKEVEATLNEVKQALEEVRKAIRNESN